MSNVLTGLFKFFIFYHSKSPLNQHLGEFFPTTLSKSKITALHFAQLVRALWFFDLWGLWSGFTMALAWLSKQWATFRQWLGRTEVPVQLEVVQLGSETRKQNWHTDVLGVRKSKKLQVEYLQHSKLFWVQKSTFFVV